MERQRVSRVRRPGRRRETIGTAPGTLVVDPDAPKPVIRVFAYGPEKSVEQDGAELSSLRGLLGAWPVVWVNVDGLGDADVLARLGEIFQLHPLALEDVVQVTQRPKVDQYGPHLFLVTRMVTLGEHVETEQLSMFLGAGFVVTFQQRVGDCLDGVRERIRKGTGRMRTNGADYLAYAILDAVIDNCFPVLEALGERLEDLEDNVIAQPRPQRVGEIHAVKRDLLAMRRVAWPQREAINVLLRGDNPIIAAETRVYLRDCYDHVTHIIDMVETHREMASGLMDAYLSSLSNRMNEIMKVLTIIATIFIPLTFIVGNYGMNFRDMPELHWRYGYPAVWAVMVAIAAGMLWWFRRRRWI